ncbi:MAG: hypothetical protein WCN27_02990 [Alphaproteobacteria bacterium]
MFKNKLTKIIFYAFIFMLSGCAILPEVDSYDPKVFANSQKGIVIFKIVENSNGESLKDGFEPSYRIRKLGGTEVFRVDGKNGLVKIFADSSYCSQVMMLDPGVYYIDYLALAQMGNIIRWYPGPGIVPINKETKNKYLVTIGAFEVKPGKISYLGLANLPGGELPFQITNEIEHVRTDLKSKGMHELAEKVVFEPIYKDTSVIIREGDNVSFVSSEEIERRRLKLIDLLSQKAE